ncbi:transcription factor cwo-like isoform X2 [Uloborus diversus]|nr:transcription factor cwo-like isoform X2 [Uloborus diversus]
MSHRIIEKRRRDRMNNCLADLSRLVPTNYLKKGRGRIEKTEIIEMAIKHLKHLQAHPCKDPGHCEVAKATEQDHKRQYRLGYQECMSETVRFMVESEGLFSGDGVCVRLINHLQKHYDKVAGGLCYTQALGLMVSEESKNSIHMEVENTNSCFPSESSPTGTMMSDSHRESPYPYENRKPELQELKQENEMNGLNSHPPICEESSPPVKVTSQLREMLQNPGVPKETSRCSSSNGNHPAVRNISPLLHPTPVTVTVTPSSNNDSIPKHEEGYYKFKNSIQHRFNADLRHNNPSSPTDSHASDRMSLPEEDHNNNNPKFHISEASPLRPSNLTHNGSDERLGHNGSGSLQPALLSNGHAFSHYSPNHSAPSELSVKIPERSHDGYSNPTYSAPPHWDSHAETASSCGSNPSPSPTAARSCNGSSSGYSTNGDNIPNGSKVKSSHSPVLSPYSHTPDRMSNRSPSPVQGPGVPIFALHPKGTFYVPLTIDSSLLIPYLIGSDDIAPVLHPISICINLSNHSMKVEKLNGATFHHRPHSSFIMEKFHDRLMYADRHPFYPCPVSPARNGCS